MDWRCIGLAAGLLALSSTALAQTDEGAPIVVQAPSASQEAQVRGFVGQLSAPAMRGGVMPRWAGPLCLGAVGMQPTHARAMNDRIGDVARSVGVAVSAPGCEPNVLIFFTATPDAVAQQVASRPTVASANNEHGVSLGEEALGDFVSGDRPVRWWHVSETATTDGFGVDRDSRQSGVTFQNNDSETPTSSAPTSFDDREPGASASNAVRVRDASRLRGNIRQDLARVVIIIDSENVRDVLFGSLVDYVAMITLAQINPNADIAQLPSILNLFSRTSDLNADELTEWDLAYLRGLYRSQADARTSRDQERQIVRSMMRGGSAAATDDEDEMQAETPAPAPAAPRKRQ